MPAPQMRPNQNNQRKQPISRGSRHGGTSTLSRKENLIAERNAALTRINELWDIALSKKTIRQQNQVLRQMAKWQEVLDKFNKFLRVDDNQSKLIIG